MLAVKRDCKFSECYWGHWTTPHRSLNCFCFTVFNLSSGLLSCVIETDVSMLLLLLLLRCHGDLFIQSMKSVFMFGWRWQIQKLEETLVYSQRQLPLLLPVHHCEYKYMHLWLQPCVGPWYPLFCLFPPLSTYFLIFCSVYFFPFSFSHALYLFSFLFISSLSTRIVTTLFPGRRCRRRSNLGLVCFVNFVLSVLLS